MVLRLRQRISNRARAAPQHTMTAAVVVDDAFGTVATVIGVLALLPQIVLTFRARTVAGLSLASLAVGAVSNVFWVGYGCGNIGERWLVVVSALVTLMQTAALYFLYLDIATAGGAPQSPDSAPQKTSPASAGTSDSRAAAQRAPAPAQTAATGPARILIVL